jgi:phage-related protein
MEIDYYQTSNGACPVLEFIAGLPPEDRVRVTEKIRLLAQLGRSLRRPHSDTLRDGIRELRIKTHHGQYRILHFIFYRDTAVLLHGITKKTGKVPDSAIDKAIKYMRDYVRTHTEE